MSVPDPSSREDGSDAERDSPGEHDSFAEHDWPAQNDEVVETDFIEGGWDAWDLTAPSLRSFSEQGLAPRRSRPGDPSALLARAVAEIVFTWRTDRGMRQREAAAHLGVGQSWISRIERRDAPVSIDLLARVASVTGTDVSLRFVPGPAARPTRRIVRTGRCGRATVQVVVTGPEARAARTDEGLRDPIGEPTADPRRAGPIF